MITIAKTWPDIPFSHRQHKHDGHCAFSHGHNWAFTVEFGARHLDSNGFVIDFGKLGAVKEWLLDTFDHSHLFNQDDAAGLEMLAQYPAMFKGRIVPDASAEGLCVYVASHLDHLLGHFYPEDVSIRELCVVAVTVHEDSKNTATWRRQ